MSSLGYACCIVAGVGFAVNYLPVKGCDCGDGIFFSAVMSLGILLVGLCTGMCLGSLSDLKSSNEIYIYIIYQDHPRGAYKTAYK